MIGQTFSDSDYANRKRTTQREKFLSATLLRFRHLLEGNGIGEQIFEDVTARLDAAGLLMHGGSIVEATIISAPTSAKNQEKKCDPEMHQTKKGAYWHFGMKIHAGVSTGSGHVRKIMANPGVCDGPRRV